jgi:CTP:molybdopterin cytidylyltransferase MocA
VTVAAVIGADSAEAALAEASARAAARRLVETAWAGGAVPIVVVAPDRDGAVADALTGSAAILAEPAPPPAGEVGQILRGMDVAAASVTETDAALSFPVRLAWVDAETVTSLIQAHGLDPASVLRPTWHGQPGWPVLFPMTLAGRLRAIGVDRSGEDALTALAASGLAVRTLELGDPGIVFDISTSLEELPPYEGPAEPLAPPPEWGLAGAERTDDVPLEGPALAPYEQAAEDT